MNEVMSRAEIEARFPNEWILMVDPEAGGDVTSGAGGRTQYKPERAVRKVEGVSAAGDRRFLCRAAIPAGMQVLL